MGEGGRCTVGGRKGYFRPLRSMYVPLWILQSTPLSDIGVAISASSPPPALSWTFDSSALEERLGHCSNCYFVLPYMKKTWHLRRNQYIQRNTSQRPTPHNRIWGSPLMSLDRNHVPVPGSVFEDRFIEPLNKKRMNASLGMQAWPSCSVIHKVKTLLWPASEGCKAKTLAESHEIISRPEFRPGMHFPVCHWSIWRWYTPSYSLSWRLDAQIMNTAVAVVYRPSKRKRHEPGTPKICISKTGLWFATLKQEGNARERILATKLQKMITLASRVKPPESRAYEICM